MFRLGRGIGIARGTGGRGEWQGVERVGACARGRGSEGDGSGRGLERRGGRSVQRRGGGGSAVFPCAGWEEAAGPSRAGPRYRRRH